MKSKNLLVPALTVLALLSTSCNYPHSKGYNWLAPNWTPDGRIVFIEWYLEFGRKLGGIGNQYSISRTYLCLINKDGTGYTRLTDSIGVEAISTAASKDKLIACVTDQEGRCQMLLFDYNGNLLKTLGQGAYADFSPDGKKIVYQKYEGSHPKGIWIMDLESGEERCLSSNSEDMMPSWSPDGGRIAFIKAVDWYRDVQLWVMDTSGQNQEFIFKANRAYNTDWGPLDTNAVLSVMNDRVLFFYFEGDTVRVDSSFPGYFGAGYWSPDGSRIVFGGICVYLRNGEMEGCYGP